MKTFDIEDNNTGMKINISGETMPNEQEIQQLFATARKKASISLAKGNYKTNVNYKTLSDSEQIDKIQNLASMAMGVAKSDVDVHSGMDFWERTKLMIQSTDADKMKQLEDTYGKDGVAMLDVGGTAKMFFRNPKTKKMTMVDEQGTSFADFTADIAGDIAPTAGAVLGGGIGLAVGGIPGSIAGAALGGGLVRGAQDVITRTLSDEDIRGGEIAERAIKEAAVGAIFDFAFLGTGRLASKVFKSKLTGDASAGAFAKVAGDVPEGSFTPRMLQGEEALTREVGIEGQVGGRVGDARQAIHTAAEREVGQVSTGAFERFSQKATQDRDKLLRTVPEGDTKLAAQINKQYNDKLRGFGAGDGRVVSDIGDEVIKDSVAPALKAAKIQKNKLYKVFDAEDAAAAKKSGTGGIFTAKEVNTRFKRVIAKNGMKNTAGVESVQKGILTDKKKGKSYTLKEVDDLISNVTDAMPDGILKSRTAQQVAAQLSDSLTTLVRGKAKKFPKLNEAWKEANAYYKNTYTKFGRGGIGGATKDASGETVLSGQGFMQSILSDPRQIKNITSIAKEGGISPSVLKGRIKEAFLTSKGIRKGENIGKLTLTEADRGVVKELWGSRGLKRLEAIKKGMKASPDDLEAYLGALSDRQAIAAKRAMEINAAEAKKLDRFTENSILKKMVAGDMPVENQKSIVEAIVKSTDSNRAEILGRMDAQSLADLRSMVGADVLSTDLYNSGFKNAIGEHMFNGTSVLNKLKNKSTAKAYKDILGQKEYQKLVDLADAQSRLAPLNRQEAQTKLRTTFGAKGISLFVVGDMLQSIKDKVVSLAYRTKSLDKFASGWSKADPGAIKTALDNMLTGSRANRALIDMDDPEFEADLRQIRSAME
jgi:hypothetical protein